MDIIDTLAGIVGSDGVLQGEAVASRAEGTWRPQGIAARAIVRPRSTDEVARVLAACNQAGQPVVAHGGRTGLVEGHVAAPHELVLSLERMNRIEEIDAADRTAVVQAGVVLQALQEEAARHDLLFAVDLGGRGSCTIGGNIATNAGGNSVIRYGMTRESVLGLEVVLADGSVLPAMNRMIKNNAGYDLKHCFIGSEGTLGIVTRAVVRLRERPRSQETLLVAVDSFAAVLALLKRVDAGLGGALSAFEVMWNDFYRLVTTPPAQGAPPLPQSHAFYVLVEAQGGDAAADRARIESLLAQCLDEGLVADAVLAGSDAQRRALWALRDDVGQAFRFAPTFVFDVSLRITAMSDYVDAVRAQLAREFPHHDCFTFGHIGDGNIHFAISTGDEASHARVQDIVYAPLRPLGGSVSAEHGIGLEKKRHLAWCRSPQEIALMRTLKQALDPRNILNPGRIF
jgi:FAD/FMN-containing dehydrogenase